MNFITAHKIHDGRKFLDGPVALVISDTGTILDLVPLASLDRGNVRSYEGILCPGFINAHCHLELSHLRGKIPEHTGLVEFALGIIQNRYIAPVEEIRDMALEADRQMWINGIVAVGDICNTAHTIQTKAASKIRYHSFIELIGLNPARAEQVFADGLALQNEYQASQLPSSLAPHAPYSVSYRLMKLIAQQQAISSIHNQESSQEDLFFKSKTGDFLKLYSSLNVSIDHFAASGRSSLQSYLPHLKNEKGLLLVHNTFSSAEDIAFAESLSEQLFWCLCPNANLYIENTMPPAELLDAAGCRVCFGTDSLASNHGLSVLGEMQSVGDRFPGIAMEKLINWATYNGAAFLGLADRFGTIEKNRAPGINLITQNKGGLSVDKLF